MNCSHAFWSYIHQQDVFPLQMLTDLNTYLNKAIPDTRLTIKKYLDVKFEYLVSCFLYYFFFSAD